MINIFSAATSLGSYNQGCELAPKAILDISLEESLKKNNIPYCIKDATVLASGDIGSESSLRYHRLIVDYNKSLFNSIVESSRPGDIALTLGGDHSISIATMFATKHRYNDAVVVYIDAHPDCNGPNNTPTGNIHGMPLSTVLGEGIYGDFRLAKYRFDEVYIIGIKDIDDSEQAFMDQHHILNITIDDITQDGISACLTKIKKQINGRPVHVSLDIDSIDVSEAPGTGIINKGGLSFREISYMTRNLQDENIVAIDITEVNPQKDIDNKTIHLSAELVVNLIHGKWTSYTRYLTSKH